jgi:hypothetical protein
MLLGPTIELFRATVPVEYRTFEISGYDGLAHRVEELGLKVEMLICLHSLVNVPVMFGLLEAVRHIALDLVWMWL